MSRAPNQEFLHIGPASGLGSDRKQNVHGPEGIRFYTHAKAITSRWPDSADQEHHRTHMHFPTAT